MAHTLDVCPKASGELPRLSTGPSASTAIARAAHSVSTQVGAMLTILAKIHGREGVVMPELCSCSITW